MRDFMKGLFGNFHTNRISSTKFWNGVGIITMTAMVVYLGIEKDIPEWMGWVYVFMVTPSRLMNSLIDLRWGRSPAPKKEEENNG